MEVAPGWSIFLELSLNLSLLLFGVGVMCWLRPNSRALSLKFLDCLSRLSVPFHSLWWVSFLLLLLWLFSFTGSEESCIFPTFLLILPSLTRLTFCLLLFGIFVDPEAVGLIQAEMKEDFTVSSNV